MAITKERRKKPYLTPELRHKLATPLEHLLQSFHRIKMLSSCAEIDRICVGGISTIITVAGTAEIQRELDQLRERRIDPMQ